jgi:hypothetical protein
MAKCSKVYLLIFGIWAKLGFGPRKASGYSPSSLRISGSGSNSVNPG